MQRDEKVRKSLSTHDWISWPFDDQSNVYTLIMLHVPKSGSVLFYIWNT